MIKQQSSGGGENPAAGQKRRINGIYRRNKLRINKKMQFKV